MLLAIVNLVNGESLKSQILGLEPTELIDVYACGNSYCLMCLLNFTLQIIDDYYDVIVNVEYKLVILCFIIVDQGTVTSPVTYEELQQRNREPPTIYEQVRPNNTTAA